MTITTFSGIRTAIESVFSGFQFMICSSFSIPIPILSKYPTGPASDNCHNDFVLIFLCPSWLKFRLLRGSSMTRRSWGWLEFERSCDRDSLTAELRQKRKEKKGRIDFASGPKTRTLCLETPIIQATVNRIRRRLHRSDWIDKIVSHPTAAIQDKITQIWVSRFNSG